MRISRQILARTARRPVSRRVERLGGVEAAAAAKMAP
jgi:hypothetical protein